MTKLLEQVTTISNSNHDDQKALNLALVSLGIEWDKESEMLGQNSTGIGRGAIIDGDEHFVVSLLPHSTYPRWCDRSPVSPTSTIVEHCTVSV